MQHDLFSALVREHQQELLRAAREAAPSRALRAQSGGVGSRPLLLRLLARVLGPR